MINLNFFKNRKDKKLDLSKGELIEKIEKELSSLQLYSIQVLENIMIYERTLNQLTFKLKELKEQSKCALYKSNTRLYTKSLIKISDNENKISDLSNTISELNQKLDIAKNDIRYLEDSLDGL